MRAYKKHHKLPLRVNATKTELVEVISRHFAETMHKERLDERRIIQNFIKAVKKGNAANMKKVQMESEGSLFILLDDTGSINNASTPKRRLPARKRNGERVNEPETATGLS